MQVHGAGSQQGVLELKDKRINANYREDLLTAYRVAREWLHQKFGSGLVENLSVMDYRLERYVQWIYAQNAAETKRAKQHRTALYAVLGYQHKHRWLRGGLPGCWDSLDTWRLELPVRMRLPIGEEPAMAIALWALAKALTLDVANASGWFGLALGTLLMWALVCRPGEYFKLR